MQLDDRLLTLIEDLIGALELRDAADPEVPAWEATARIRGLEAELLERCRTMPRRAVRGAARSARGREEVGSLGAF